MGLVILLYQSTPLPFNIISINKKHFPYYNVKMDLMGQVIWLFYNISLPI